uniref:Uncharacterized protein n=1 Tax=Anguilla anguilla TaxID=7936 RepID=A0A0E9PQB9_ANGAN
MVANLPRSPVVAQPNLTLHGSPASTLSFQPFLISFLLTQSLSTELHFARLPCVLPKPCPTSFTCNSYTCSPCCVQISYFFKQSRLWFKSSKIFWILAFFSPEL